MNEGSLKLVKRSKVRLRADRKSIMTELPRDAEESFNRNNFRPAFRVIKKLSSVPALGGF